MRVCRMPVPNAVKTGRNINRLRKEAGMSVRDIQSVFGFGTPNAIYKWLRGDCMPSLDSLVTLSALFGVPIDEIVGVDWIG